MAPYDSDTDSTIIVESPIPAESPTLGTSTERKDDAVCKGSQAEGHRATTSPDEVSLSAPLWARRLYSKLSNIEGRLDKLKHTVDSFKSTEPYVASHLGALDERVDDLEKTGDGMKDTIKGVQDDISNLERAKDETLMHIDEELEKLRNGPTTRWSNVSVSLGLGFSTDCGKSTT